MIALLLALAPVYWHPELKPCVERKLPAECHFRVDPVISHCTAAERIRETGQPLECTSYTADDLYSLCRHNGGTPPQCAAEDAWVNDEISYCIWRSDGTVEAKNATCSD